MHEPIQRINICLQGNYGNMYVITYKYNGINDNATYLQKINNEIGSNYDVFFSYFKT